MCDYLGDQQRGVRWRNRDTVEDAVGETRLVKDFGYEVVNPWSELRAFEHNSVSTKNGDGHCSNG